MNADAWTVVKVGGSLFDWPELRDRLNAWLATLDASRVLLIPGGGQSADAVRHLDRAHHLGEEAAHWLAIEAMAVNARFLQELLPEATIVGEPEFLACASGSKRRLYLLDASPFFRADDTSADHLPHRWHVTSDSLSVRAAVLASARELILLKSVAWQGADWAGAMRADIVDGYFVEALQQTSHELHVRVVNLRTWF